MKLIIDIDENVFTRLFDNGVDTSPEDRKVIDSAVRNGMPYAESPQEDLISREALRKRLDELHWTLECGFDKRIYLDSIIDNAPTVEAFTEEDIKQAIKENFDIGYEMAKNKYARPKGEWIKMSDRYGVYFACEKCGYDRERAITNFCPNCGADMRGNNNG